jgi:hypothetical protein
MRVNGKFACQLLVGDQLRIGDQGVEGKKLQALLGGLAKRSADQARPDH